jgi:hypothetical protein
MSDIDDDGVEVATEYSRVSEAERLAVADKLRSWIDGSQPENKEILNRLEADIREDQRLENWAAFTLEDLMQPPRYSEIQTLWSRIGDIVVLIRNTLLFFPVLVTWYALEQAADAYSEYLDEFQKQLAINPDLSDSQRQTFLQIWSDPERIQTLLGSLTLQRVALWDAVIILLLIAFTIAEWGLRQRAKFAAEANDRANDLTFRTVLVDVGLFLHGFRQITPTAITGSLGEAVNKLRAATVGIRDVADDMKRLSASADATLTRFAELASRELEPSAKRLDSIVGSLGIAVDAHKAMGDMVRSLQRELGESLGVITSRLDDLGTNLDRRLESQTEKLEFALREMVTETEAVGKRLASASAAAEEVARSLRTAAGVR